MKHLSFFVRFVLLSVFCLPIAAYLVAETAASHPVGSVSSSYSVPLSFAPNRGQADAGVDYVSDLPGHKFQIRRDGFDVVDVRCSDADYSPKPDAANVRCSNTTKQTISVRLRGANPAAASTATELLPGKHNFLAGPKSAWRQDLPGYGRLRYKDVYPGIDLAYHAATSRPMILEYDFEIAPRADAAKIRLHFEGGGSRIGSSGDLTLETGNSDLLHWSAPVAYQVIGGEPKIIPARYVAYGNNEVGFRLGAYDHSRSVVIDPALAYSEMLAGDLFLMKPDPSGAVYVYGLGVGGTLMKIQADGTLGYTTTLPASMQTLFAFTVDQNGAAYFTGQTGGGLPTTPGVLQPNYGGGATNAFIAKLAPSGASFDYVTYYGAGPPTGPLGNGGTSIAVDIAGNAYVAGYATGTGLPTTVGAYKTVPDNPPDANVWVAKISAAGSQLDYATFIGDLGALIFPEVSFDPSSGSAVVLASSSASSYPVTAGAYNFPGGGTFVTKVKNDGTGLTYSAQFPGGSDIAVDNIGAVYLTGLGGSQTPTTPGAYETVYPAGFSSGATVAFVAKFDPTGSTLVYSTFLDISQCFPHQCVQAPNVVVDASGSAYIGGTSRTPGAAVVNPIQATLGDVGLPTVGDAFVAVLNPSGSNLTFETYLGGASLDILQGIGIDSSLNIYVAGNTSGNSFPFTSGSATLGANNSFVAKITPTGGPVGVFVPPLNSFSTSGFAPGTLQFGTGVVGVGAAPQTIVFGNYGGAAFNISDIAVTGDFSQTNNCPTTLQPGANCQLVITFTPTAVGARSGSLTITDNAVGGSQQASFSGTGIAPAVTLAPTSLSFGSQAVGTSSAPQAITVTNSGSANLSITGIAVQGDFSQTNACGGAIVPLASCMIAVTFTPTASGPRTGSLSLTDNAPGSPQQVALAGNTDFAISAAPGSATSAAVAAGQTASYALSLTPSAGFSGTVALSCTGAPTGATCSIPASMQLNSPTPATVNVTVSTTRTASLLRSSSGPSPWLWVGASIGFAGLLLVSKPPKRMLGAAVSVLLAGMLLSISSCGGGSNPPGPNPNPTPTGTYTLTVTATVNATSHTILLTLMVQ
jgi:hypothetical protein